MRRKTEDLKPWEAGVALMGPDKPKSDGHIEHLIEYLLTVHKRFGNTTVTTQLQWGASALWKRDEQAEQLAAKDAEIEGLRKGIVRLVSEAESVQDAFLTLYGGELAQDRLQKMMPGVDLFEIELAAERDAALEAEGKGEPG